MVKNYVSIFIYLPMDIQIFQHCWKDCSFFTELPLCLYQSIIVHTCLDLFLDSIPFHWSICLYLHQYHTVLITVVFKSLNQVVLAFIFFKVILAIVGTLYLHMNFKIWLSISTKEAAGIWTDVALNLSIYLGENWS